MDRVVDLSPAVCAAIARLASQLDAKRRRHFAGIWAALFGRGGIELAAELTGLSRQTVARGRREVLSGQDPYPGRVRVPGGGRKPAQKKIPA